MGTIQDKLNYLNTTKGLIKQAIIDKGQTIADTDTFRSYANKISGIKSGSELNVFVQDTEPETKDGIWIKASNKTVEKIITDENVYASETWGEVDNTLPHSFSYGQAVAVGNDIYLFGGSGSKTATYKYNTLTNEYTKLNDIPATVNKARAVLVGKDIYLFGCAQNGNEAYKYDTTEDTYTKLNDIPYYFRDGGVVAVENNIYLLGSSVSGKERTMTLYDIEANTYTIIGGLPYKFYGGGVVSTGNDFYIFGSFANSKEKNAYKYSLKTKMFTKLEDIPYEFHYGGIALIGTSIYLLGTSNSLDLKEAYKYNISTNEYIKLDDTPYDFYDGCAVGVGNQIYLLGASLNSYSKYKVTFTAIEKEYDNNTVVIAVGINKYNTNLINSDNQKVKTFFYDAWLKTENGLEKNNPTYYGDGIQWICFKNDPTEEVTE